MWGVGNPETFLEHPFDSRGESLAEGRLALSLFEIGCPFRVERLGMTFNFDVPNDRGVRGSDEPRTLPVRGSEGPLR